MDKEQHLNDLFAKARSQAPQVSFEETKTQFVQSLENSVFQSNKPKSQLFTLKNKIIMSLSVLITASILSLFIWSKTGNQGEVMNDLAKQENTTAEVENIPVDSPVTSKPIKTWKSQQKIQTQENAVCSMPDVYLPENHVAILISTDEDHTPKSHREKHILKANEVYSLPKLTDDEIKKTVKQKKKMMKDLMKPESRVYAFIPAGSFEYLGERISISSYYMQRTEVTNLEYRTFLFDLVMQNRLEEFLVAKPDEDMWIKMFDKDAKVLAELYFSHPAYDEYPVVNISRSGAELYCKWLDEEVQKFAKNKPLPFFHPRIPTRQEWVNAASVQGKKTTFPWGGEAIQNEEQCYLANHKPTDSTYFDDGGFFTVKVTSYTANEFGLFNMSGNVAEMVVDGALGNENDQTRAKSLTPGTAGGGWMNTANEVKISAPDNHPNHTEAHPNIGFRVVMTHLGALK